MSTTYATRALDDMRGPILAEAACAGRAIRTGLSNATVDLMEATDLLDGMAAAARLLMALEAVRDAADAGVRVARERLLTAMQDTGATRVDIGTHTVSVREGSRTAHVEDETLIPPQWMRQPPPAPDRVAIGNALRAGETIPGCALRNGAPGLVFRSKENPR